jgi:hypothetical protein
VDGRYKDQDCVAAKVPPHGTRKRRAVPPREMRTMKGQLMSTSAGPSSSEQQKRKICEACGREFSCGAPAAGCWCEEIRLTVAAREEIASRYSNCLCSECLEHFITNEQMANPKGTR